jgi:hypothetical protein
MSCQELYINSYIDRIQALQAFGAGCVVGLCESREIILSFCASCLVAELILAVCYTRTYCLKIKYGLMYIFYANRFYLRFYEFKFFLRNSQNFPRKSDEFQS